MPRTHVGFIAEEFEPEAEDAEPEQAPAEEPGDPPDDRWTDEPPPPGEPLATWLAQRLEAAGWQVLYRWATPYGHAFDATRAKRRYDVELRQVDRDEGRWLVTARVRSGFFTKLLGSKGDPVEHALLCANLHEALTLDERISAPAWYSEDEWQRDPRGPGNPEPGH